MAKFKGFGKAPQDKNFTARAISEAFTIALEHYQAGRLVLSEKMCRQIIQQQPSHLEALHWLGSIAYQSGRLEEAAGYCQKALTLNPNNLEILGNLGSILQEMGKLEAAVLNFQKALAFDPNYALGHHGLGVTFIQQGKLDLAVTHLRQAIALNPNDAKTYCSLGVALWEQGLPLEALFSYQKTIQLTPDLPEAHTNLGQILLSMGDFSNGFAELEWRLLSQDWADSRQFLEPLWDGSHLEGKTILLHADLGFGDTIQFIRYVPMVAARGGRVIVECPKSLRRLLSTFSGIEQLVVPGETLPEFQVHLPLMSLPHILGATLETIPAQIPYLFPPARHHLKLEALPGTNLKVGIVWASGYRKESRNFLRDYQRRSCCLSRYTPLLSIPGISFFSLQVGHHATEITQVESGHQLQDLSPQIRDFADTAALITQMDLVISVDTAVAHLAGALGKPVWVLLPFTSDWRWFLGREDSPWYPTMRLFRQSQPGDWEGVLEKVAQALSCFRLREVESPQLSQLEALNRLGITAYQSGRLEEAADYCQKTLALNPNNLEILSNLGSVLQDVGKLDAAVLNFQKALAINPDYAFAHHGLGVTFMQQGKLEPAVTHLRRAIALNPNDAMAHTNLGNVLREQGELPAGILHFQIALALQPNYAFAHNGLGIALGNQDQWEAAIAHFRQAVALNPNYADAHNNLGFVLQEVGKLEEAAIHYQTAIALHPDNPIAYTNLGNLLYEQGHQQEAILNFHKALALNPNDAEAHNSLAAVLQEVGKWDEAAIHLRTGDRPKPSSANSP